MRPDLHADITRRLMQDFAFKARKEWLREGKCPECGKKELYTKTEAPWVLWCGRRDKCGAEIHVKDLYRDLFESWSDRYQSTETEPHAAAEAYLMHARGFPLARLKGAFTQEWYHDRQRNIGTATVRFALPNGAWWERLIDRPERFGKMKARFAPGKSMHGHWWRLPDATWDADEIWLTEGIFDTVALELAGVASAALLSCNNYPVEGLSRLAKECADGNRLRPMLVWALDDGAAGQQYMRKWHERARKEGWRSRCAYTPNKGGLKQDWNELHLRGRLDADALDTARYHGDLLLAPSANAKALLMYKRKPRGEFHFDFGDQLHWFRYDDSKYQKAMEALEAKEDSASLSEEEKRDKALAQGGVVTRIANCNPQPLYFQRNEQTKETWYYIRLSAPGQHKPVNGALVPSQIAAAARFKEALLGLESGVIFSGTTPQLDKIVMADFTGLKRVEALDYVGYSAAHGCYLLGDLGVKDGALFKVNDEDYFEFDRKTSLKSINQSVALAINPSADDYHADWINLVWECFGAKGLVAVAFWFGSLFAEQIRKAQASYPFLEVIGEAGSGKTTLIEFLWRLLGRDEHEGFDPVKSTAAARARLMAQVANLPVVLIEADRDGDTDRNKQRGFDWNELKTAYNGRSTRVIGVKSAGNETKDSPFRGAIVIAQNAEVQASDAILQRIVHLSFDKAAHTPRTGALAKQLERMPVEQVSGFILRAVQAEAKVLQRIEAEAGAYAEQLLRSAEIKSVRIAKNHGQMMALMDALREVIPGVTDVMWAATHAELFTMAVARQNAINADHPWVAWFWETFDNINGQGDTRLDHSRNPAYIAINLGDFEERVSKRGLKLPCHDMTEMKRVLKSSRRYPFDDVRAVNSFVTGGTRKCWVFKAPPPSPSAATTATPEEPA